MKLYSVQTVGKYRTYTTKCRCNQRIVLDTLDGRLQEFNPDGSIHCCSIPKRPIDLTKLKR